MSGTTKGYIAITAQSVIIGFTAFFVKIALPFTSPNILLGHRLLVALVCCFVALLITRQKLNIRASDLKALIPLAIVYPVLFFTTQTYSLRTLPATESALIYAVAPIITVILAVVFLKEKTGALQILFLVISVGGVVFLMIMKGVSPEAFDIPGTLWYLGCAISFSVYMTLNRRIAGKYSPLVVAFFMAAAGALVFNVMAIGTSVQQGSLMLYLEPFTDPRYLFSILFLGGCGVFGTSALASLALKYIESSKIGVFPNLSTVISILSGALLLQENFYWYYAVGAIVIITGVLGTNYFGNRIKRQDGEKPVGALAERPVPPSD